MRLAQLQTGVFKPFKEKLKVKPGKPLSAVAGCLVVQSVVTMTALLAMAEHLPYKFWRVLDPFTA